MRLSFIIVLIAATFVIVAFAANEDDINHDITDQDHKHNHHEHEHHDHLEHDQHEHLEHEQHDEEHELHDEKNEVGLWLASVGSIIAISLCGIFGVLVIPIMQKVSHLFFKLLFPLVCH